MMPGTWDEQGGDEIITSRSRGERVSSSAHGGFSGIASREGGGGRGALDEARRRWEGGRRAECHWDGCGGREGEDAPPGEREAGAPGRRRRSPAAGEGVCHVQQRRGVDKGGGQGASQRRRTGMEGERMCCRYLSHSAPISIKLARMQERPSTTCHLHQWPALMVARYIHSLSTSSRPRIWSRGSHNT